MGITCRGQDLEYTIIDREKGDIESSTTEIVDEDLRFTTLLIKTVGDGGSGRPANDTENLETGDGTSIFSSLTLDIVEVGRDGDDGVGDLLAEVSLSGLLHLFQYHGGDFFGGEVPPHTTVLDRNCGLSVLLDNLQGPG